MANVNAAFGLRPYRMLGSGANTNGDSVYSIQTTATSGTSSVIYQGTPVIPLANGMIDIVGNANGGTVPLLGVFLGCNYIDLTGKPKFSPFWPGTAAVKSGTAATAIVVSNPDQAFLINCNAAAADAIVHANANFATATSGSTTSGLSSAQLAVSTVDVTNTLNMRILGFSDVPDSSDATVAGRLAIVLLNNHFYRYNANATGGGGSGI
jgi:hypothetical protein